VKARYEGKIWKIMKFLHEMMPFRRTEFSALPRWGGLGMRAWNSSWSPIGKKLLMIGRKTGFPISKNRESHDCRSPWSGTLGTLYQALLGHAYKTGGGGGGFNFHYLGFKNAAGLIILIIWLRPNEWSCRSIYIESTSLYIRYIRMFTIITAISQNL
jgi:hypothetical protein